MRIVLPCPSTVICSSCRSQQLADLLDLPTDNMTDDPATPKGQQTAYNGVYILQQPKEEGAKKSRFGTREQVKIPFVMQLPVCRSINRMQSTLLSAMISDNNEECCKHVKACILQHTFLLTSLN